MQLLSALTESQRALQEHVRVQAEWMRSETESRTQRSVIDTKALGRPAPFAGKRDEWAGWAYKFSTWFGSQFEHGVAMLEWALSREEAITDEEVELQASTMPQVKRASSQLFAVLVSLMTPGTDGLELVCHAIRATAWMPGVSLPEGTTQAGQRRT